MDYQKALDNLRLRLEGTPRFLEFLDLEHRLRANLSRGSRHGADQTIRTERSEIVEALNAVTIETLGITFNDLLFGRLSAAHPTSDQLVRLTAELGTEALPFSVDPPVQTRRQDLPLGELSWKQFELLCAALVQSLPDVLDVHLYGVEGDFQKGIDLVATQVRSGLQEKWVYQCKRHQEYSARELQEALDRITYPADFYVLMLSSNAGAPLRDVVERREATTFLWDKLDISRKLKLYPRLVEDFFGKAWREAFNGPLT